MRFIVASFLMVSTVCALNAEPFNPMAAQKFRVAACSTNQISVVQSCRARCDEVVYECRNRCVGQACAQQCGPTHSACQQTCIKSSGC